MNAKKWYQQTDILLGTGVIAIIMMLIVPIPTFILDFLMIISIMLGLIILLTALFNTESNQFSVFPTLLLITTIFRLTINVSSTRMILLEGSSFDGKLVQAFGTFVVGGNYLVGFIIFLILIFVQMMVITKGATRISEVTARFALDGLPGKQISIDSDLSAGLITEEEAKLRRRQLEQEIEFAGQMDGASKFIQGDVRVGLIITAINIIGGIIVGTILRDESLPEAAKLYTLLSVGDGLIAQIPSLLITTATGIIITRSGATEKLGEELASQLFHNSKILWIVSISLGIAAFVPGFPMIPLLFISFCLGLLAYRLSLSAHETISPEQQQKDSQTPQEKTSSDFIEEWTLEAIKVEIGFHLISLVDKEQGGQLIERITNLRKKFAKDMGMLIPPVRISDNMELDSNEYAVLINGIEVSKISVYPDKIVALDTGNVSKKLEGPPYKDPAYNINGILLPPESKAEAEEAGYTTADATNIIITHLNEIFHNFSTQIIGIEEIKTLLEKVREKYPSVVDDAIKQLTYNGILQILHNLLKENVSIKNLPIILDAISQSGDKIKDVNILTEIVRKKLGRQIIQNYVDSDKSIEVVQIDPYLESQIRLSIVYNETEGKVFNLDPHLAVEITDQLVQAFNRSYSKSKVPIFILSSEVRSSILYLLERELNTRQFVVLAYEEIPNDIQIKPIDQVMIQQQKKEEYQDAIQY